MVGAVGEVDILDAHAGALDGGLRHAGKLVHLRPLL
jgi:hypothetical protein